MPQGKPKELTRDEELARIPANMRGKKGVEARLNTLFHQQSETAQFREEEGEEQNYGRGRGGNKSLETQQARARANWERMVNALRGKRK